MFHVTITLLWNDISSQIPTFINLTQAGLRPRQRLNNLLHVPPLSVKKNASFLYSLRKYDTLYMVAAAIKTGRRLAEGETNHPEELSRESTQWRKTNRKGDHS
jgi:hypothetical protein